MSGLAGRRVLVTRPAGQAEALATALRRAGAEPVMLPAIAVRAVDDLAPLDAALARLGCGDWIVFTSANAVAVVMDRLSARAASLPAGVRIAAVGPATARAAAARGLAVRAVPEIHTGAAIAATLGDVRGRRVALPCADIAREETAAALRAAGALLEHVVVYETVPADFNAGALAELARGVDAVTFNSPSTVEHLLGRLAPPLRRTVEAAVVACVGPTTAAAARAAGLVVAVEPARYTTDDLVRALDAHFAARNARTAAGFTSSRSLP